jgi:hypothetical protein
VNLDFTRQLQYTEGIVATSLWRRVVSCGSSRASLNTLIHHMGERCRRHTQHQALTARRRPGWCLHSHVPGALLLRVSSASASRPALHNTTRAPLQHDGRTGRRSRDSGRDGVKWARPTLPHWICRHVGLMQQTHLIPVRKGNK